MPILSPFEEDHIDHANHLAGSDVKTGLPLLPGYAVASS